MPVPQLVEMNNFFDQYLQGDCFGKLLCSLYPCHQTIEKEEQQGFSFTLIIKLCSIVGSVEAWGEQTRFYFWRYSALAGHKLSHFNSRVFSFTWNWCRLQEAKKFTRNPRQFKCVTSETRYHISIAIRSL